MSRHVKFLTVSAFNAALASGAYAFPGAYPTYFVMADGGALSFTAAESEADRIREAIAQTQADSDWHDANAQWLPVAHAVNWEDSELFCDHTGARIESAYAEPEEA